MLKEIVIAFQSYFQAHYFIMKHKLWKWIVIPGLIYAILFIGGLYFFLTSSNAAIRFMMEAGGIKAWLDKIQTSWISFMFLFGQIMLQLVLLLFYFSLFKYLFLIIGSPVFSYLSEKTESILEGKDFAFSFSQLAKDIVRGIRLAFRNLVWQSVYMVTIFFLSLVPFVGWIMPLVALFIECYYLGFSMLDYSSERHRLGYIQSIKFVGNHKGLAIGNGMVFYLLHLLPVIGWMLAPGYAVTAATLSLINAKKSKLIF